MIQLDQVKADLPSAIESLKEVGSALNLDGIRGKLEELNRDVQDPEFWDKPEKAQELLKQKKNLEARLDKFNAIETGFQDMPALIEIAEELEDEEEADGIVDSFRKLLEDLETLKLDTLLDGKYDHNNAIISIHAGTGGVDAMDWAQMLLRMYTRWADKKGYKVTMVDLQDDTEAGIKSATLIIEGKNAYGYLKNEKGTHRLVRISPFNAAGKRQTSFAALEVLPEIDDDLTVEIDPEDLRIDTYRSSGAGGQHVNKTDSAIRITHLPTHIVVTCQNERSQHQNKEMAMKILMSKLTELKEQEHKENLKELKGDFSLITWGSQIRSYVFQPYTMVKDHRTGAEVGNVNAVMDGDIDYFINEKLKQRD